MIGTLQDLFATQAYLAAMERGLAELRSSMLPQWPERYELLATPYVDEIRRLRAEIDSYLRTSEKEPAGADLTVAMKGRDIELGSVPMSVVTGTLEAIRRGLLALAAILQGREPGSMGRRGKSIEDACDFRLLALTGGSVEVSLSLPSAPQLDLLPKDALGGKAAQLFVGVAEWAAGEAEPDSLVERLGDKWPSLVAWQVLKALPREGTDLREITLGGRLVGGRHVTLDRNGRNRLQQVIELGQRVEDGELVGTIRGLDLDAGTFLLRPPKSRKRIRCLFDPLFLEEKVVAGAGQRVLVRGSILHDRITDQPKHMIARDIVLTPSTRGRN